MSKKPTTSRALIPVGQRKQPARRKSAVPVVVSATNDTLLPILGSPLAVAKLVGTGGEVTRDEGIVLVTGRAYVTRECVVPADEIYYDRTSRRGGEGPRLGEADKVSWRDEATGYECIMLRDTHRGFLSGYVGVPRGHPLWGWDSEAVPPDLGIEVHGGLTYSRLCQDGPHPARRLAFEARRICHVPRHPPSYHPTAHATDHRVEDPHCWWFGFSCDHVYDMVPADDRRPAGCFKAETGATYRDDGYVVCETVVLAAQLRAIADGRAVPPRDVPPPPIGLDPSRGGDRD